MATPDELAALRAETLIAFAGGVCPPETRIVESAGDEGAEIRTNFAGRQWDAVPDSVIEAYPDVLPLFPPEAFAYFAPAYLLYALRHFTPRTAATEQTVFAFAPPWTPIESQAQWLREQYGSLTREQVTVIEHFLDLVEADLDFREYLGDIRAPRQRFRELWESCGSG